MCGTKKKEQTALAIAISLLYGAQENVTDVTQNVVREANLAVFNANKLADDLNATVVEQAGQIVELEARVAELSERINSASQAISPVDDDLREAFGLRDVDTSGHDDPILSYIDAADVGGTPSRRGRVAIEAMDFGSFCGSPAKWTQIEVVEAGGEYDLMKFLKSEGETRKLRAVSLLEAL